MALQSMKAAWERQLKDGAQGGQLAGEEREAGRKKLNTEGVMVDQHKRERQLKDGAQGGQLAGGRERSWEEEAEY